MASAGFQFGGNSISENQQSSHEQNQAFHSKNPANEFRPNPIHSSSTSNQSEKKYGLNREGSNRYGFDEAGFNPNPNLLGNLDDLFKNIRDQLSTTTKSPESAYLNCVRTQCLAANDYNPVCGTDQVRLVL